VYPLLRIPINLTRSAAARCLPGGMDRAAAGGDREQKAWLHMSQPTPTWLKLVQTVGADLDERAAEVVGKGVGDGQGLPAGLVGSEELFRLHDRTARSFVQGCAVA
jgi:hypothetical protein